MKIISTISVLIFLLSACTSNEKDTRIKELEEKLAAFEAEQKKVEANLAVMQAVDEAWNVRDWETFNRYHAEAVVVPTTRNPEGTVGREAHHQDAVRFTTTFADHKIQLPYTTTFGSGDWIVALHTSTGTFENELPIGDGKSIPPTGKSFEIQTVTLAKIENGEIVYEHIINDQASFARQVGLGQ